MICTVVFLSEIGASTGDCVSTMPLCKNGTNAVKPRKAMEISCRQLSINGVVMLEGECGNAATLRFHLLYDTYQLEEANVNQLQLKLTMCPLVSSIEARLSRAAV